MKRIFITNIIYKDVVFNIYNIDGKLQALSDDPNASLSMINELNEIITKKDRYLKVLNKSAIKLGIAAVGMATAINFIGTVKTSDLDKLSPNSKSLITFNEEEFHKKYIDVINENKNLSDEEKKLFLDKYSFVLESYDYIYDIDSLLNMLRVIKIERVDEEGKHLVGCFTYDDGPTIKLYKDADYWTFIHEINHALKYSANYYENPYLYNGRFIDVETYNLLSKEEQHKCVRYDLIGSFFEEGYTSLLTTKERKLKTDELVHDYEEESYIYDMYEKILGEDVMKKNAFNTSKITIFLNSLIDLGYDVDTAISIATKLDLYETIKYNPDERIDTTQLKYGICDDLANVYKKKYGNTDSIYLQLITLDMIKNLDFKRIQEFENGYITKDYYEKIMNGDISVRKLLNTVNYDFNDKYGINDIELDIVSGDTILVYITIDYNHKVVLSLDNNNLKFIEEQTEKNPYEYQLYEDYSIFATDKFDNERYTNFFAACYCNRHLTENERVMVLRIFEKLHGNLDTDDFKDLMAFGNYEKIMRNLEKFYYNERFKEK